MKKIFTWVELTTLIYYGVLSGVMWGLSALTDWNVSTLLAASALYVACNERATRLHSEDS